MLESVRLGSKPVLQNFLYHSLLCNHLCLSSLAVWVAGGFDGPPSHLIPNHPDLSSMVVAPTKELERHLHKGTRLAFLSLPPPRPPPPVPRPSYTKDESQNTRIIQKIEQIYRLVSASVLTPFLNLPSSL